MGTLSSSPCQLRLGGWLSYLGLSYYTSSSGPIDENGILYPNYGKDNSRGFD